MGSGQRCRCRANPHPPPCQQQELKYAILEIIQNKIVVKFTIDILLISSPFERNAAVGYVDEASYVASITRDIISPFRCFCTRKNVSDLSL